MSFIHPPHSMRTLLTALLLALCLFPCLAWGEEDGEETLGLFTGWQESSSTASRAPKPLSQTAENVTVVTRQDIEALNAHTLTDVLATIPGIQTETRGGAGGYSSAFLQSSKFIHVLVLVDGAPLNNLSDNFSDIAMVPANIIERVEIVKGAASSSWGQALGGVINVITKSPEYGRTMGGSASASIGERTTSDTRGELTGSSGRLGYYLSGGWLGTNGLAPDNLALSSNNAYGKLTYDLPDKGQFWGTFNYSRADRGVLFLPDPAFDFKEKEAIRYLQTTLGFRRPLGNRLELELNAYHTFRKSDLYDSLISDNSPLSQANLREKVSGTSAKLIWRGANNLLVAGGDYEHAEMTTNGPSDFPSRTIDRWGGYLNDTVTLGPLAVTASARFDRPLSSPDQYSGSLGATWQLTDSTLVRGYTARGFSLPTLAFDKPAEKVWTTQLGIESAAVPGLWLKGTLFRNLIWNIKDGSNLDPNTAEQRIALGAEAEARTTPIFNTSLAAGWTYTDTYRTSNGSPVLAMPRHTVQLALRYDDQTYRGVLTGRHIYWHSDPAFNGRYYGLVWDLHLGATLLKREQSSLELFFSGHNIFNGAQYNDELVPNAGRWFEGGMRVRF